MALVAEIQKSWADTVLRCSHCETCTQRCDLLARNGADVGSIALKGQGLLDSASCQSGQSGAANETAKTAIHQFIEDNPQLYRALRECCFCNHCTAQCPMGITASQTIRPWRHLFAFANNMPPEDSKIVAVDSEWHIFSVYRAVYGIGYPEFPTLETVEPGQVDTLFFPGCTLVSYMPELIRATGAWLSGQGIRWALSDSCCGSPLMSAGLCERAWAMREGLLEQIRHSGIKRVITVCPGCGEELAEVFGEEVEFKPLPELLYERQVPIVRHSTSLTVFDSCHDRTNTRHGKALRALLANSDCVVHEMAHCGRNTLCCGAGGAVSAFSPESAQQRVARLLDEAQETGATTVLSACPTCTYTLAQELLTRERTLENRHYLELVFGERVDWAQIFAQLQGMWFGEYGAWVCQQLL